MLRYCRQVNRTFKVETTTSKYSAVTLAVTWQSVKLPAGISDILVETAKHIMGVVCFTETIRSVIAHFHTSRLRLKETPKPSFSGAPEQLYSFAFLHAYRLLKP